MSPVDRRAALTPNSLWRHYKGGVYVILHVGKLEATLEPVVVYRHPESSGTPPGEVWHGFIPKEAP